MTIAITTFLLAACVHHVHQKYPTWQAYKSVHPNVSWVVVHKKPPRSRACWKIPNGWRCVAR